MDWFTKGALAVIALALVAIAARLWMPSPATWGELQAIASMEDGPERTAAAERWRNRVPLVRLHGGSVDVDVTGVSSTVDVNVSGMP